MNMAASGQTWIARHIPYIDWALTCYSVFAFRWAIRGIVQNTTGSDLLGVFIHNPDILEALHSRFANDTISNFFDVCFGVLWVGNTWILIVELTEAWKFFRTTEARETWEPRAELYWYEQRRSNSASFAFTEVMANYILGSFLNGVVTILVRFVVLWAISMHMRELKLTMKFARSRGNNNVGPQPQLQHFRRRKIN